MTTNLPNYRVASDNIFADLGLANAAELHAKTKLTLLIKRILAQRKWTELHAAKVLGVDVTLMPSFLAGRALEHFSLTQLLLFLTKLEQSVSINVHSPELDEQEIILSSLQPLIEQSSRQQLPNTP